MAEIDNFSDLDLSDDESDELDKQFHLAAEHLKKLVSKLDNSKLLELYAHYKQGTEGKCNIPRPGFFDSKGKQKWDAWNALGDLAKDIAKQKYIALIEKIDPNFGCGSSKSPTSEAKQAFWVSVSTLQKEEEDSCGEKSILDYAKEGNSEKIKMLLKKQPNLAELKDEEGLCAAHWAADRGHVDSLKALLAGGSNVDCLDSTGQTPLHYAVSCGHVEAVEVLLRAGAHPSISDEDGDTPLDMASDPEMKKLLKTSN